MNAVLSFAGGLLALLVAGHIVVSAASHLGARFSLSPMTIGLTIVAAGTSAPELAVVGQAVAADDTELAVGSIIGSNIADYGAYLSFLVLEATGHRAKEPFTLVMVAFVVPITAATVATVIHRSRRQDRSRQGCFDRAIQ